MCDVQNLLTDGEFRDLQLRSKNVELCPSLLRQRIAFSFHSFLDDDLEEPMTVTHQDLASKAVVLEAGMDGIPRLLA